MRTRRRLALVIPVYNFEQGLPATLERLAQWQAAAPEWELQILFVDDGSTDRSAEIIQSRLPEQRSWQLLRAVRNRGKGHAVRRGIEAAYAGDPEIIVFTDCDLYYGLEIILTRMVSSLRHADIVIVDRTLSRRDTGIPVRRHFASAVFNRLVAILTGIHFKDTQAGLKGFNARACHPLFEALTLERFAFDVELLSVALHHQFSIEQVPVEFTQRQADYASSVTMLPASVQMFLDLLRINRNWKSGRYNTPALQARRQGNVHVITDD